MFSMAQQDSETLETVSALGSCNNLRTVTCTRSKSPSKLIEFYDVLMVHGAHFYFVMPFSITAMRTFCLHEHKF